MSLTDAEQQPLLTPQYDPEAAQDNAEESRNTARQSRLAELLESTLFHRTVIALITIDASCVLADLSYAFLSSTCEPPEGPDSPAWLAVLAHISLTITTLFLLEIPLALWAFGVRYYAPFSFSREAVPVPHAGLHLFDAVIIVSTFVLEVVLRGREREVAALLVLLRLWRLVKLVGGIAVGAGELEEENVKELVETKRKLEETVAALSSARNENRNLRERLAILQGTEGGGVDAE